MPLNAEKSSLASLELLEPGKLRAEFPERRQHPMGATPERHQHPPAGMASSDRVAVMLEIAQLLSQRLRLTSGILVDYLEN